MKKEVTKCHVKRAFLSTYQSKFADIDVTFVGDLDGEPDTPTAVENTAVETKAIKRIVNGQLLIEKNGKLYNITGTQVR